MDSSSARSHHQEIGSQTLESMLVPAKPREEKKPKPAEQALKCPRCDSTNTKFCYYNNYSLSQPRYFCKSCRRYWTKGGTLRNVPVGGGCRKTKRSPPSKSKNPDQTRNPTTIPSYVNPLPYEPNVCVLGSRLGIEDPGFLMPRNPNMDVGAGVFETPLGFQNWWCGTREGVNPGLESNEGIGIGTGTGTGIGLNQEIGMGFGLKQEMWGDGSWNGNGSSNWHGLLNSPLM